MNDYFNTFQNIDQSVEQLLTDEQNSIEIKQSATKLKGLVKVSFDGLYQAEDVWNSKPKIAEAAKQEIWEQLGEISGRSTRIRLLANQCKREAIKRANESWDEWIELLRNKWFIDSKGNPRKGIGFSD